MTTFSIKRVYEAPTADDGLRVLVDRLWPRGVKKTDLHAEWCKDLAPSPQLRTWWGHDPARFNDFAVAYRAELDDRGAALLDEVRELFGTAAHVTLVYAAKDPHVNHALVLRDWLTEHFTDR